MINNSVPTGDSFAAYHPQTEPVKVAYIGLSLEFYRLGDPSCVERYGKVFDHWRKNLSCYAEVTASGLCFTEAEVKQVLEKARKNHAEAVVVSAVSYTGSCMSVPALMQCGLPLVFWNTQTMDTITADYTNDDLYMNHTVQGLHDVGALLFSSGAVFQCVTGQCDDQAKLGSLAETLLSARAACRSKQMQVLCVGGMFEGMGDFLYDPEHIRRIWGPTAVASDSTELMEYFQRVPEAEVMAVSQKERSFFDMQITETDFLNSVRMALALEQLLNDRSCQALTVNFKQLLDDALLPVMPYYGINRLMAKGIGYAGEGDMLRAAMHGMLNAFGCMNCFTEIYTIDFQRNLMLMSHMQECNPAWADRRRKINLQRREFAKRKNPMPYAGMHFTLKPGAVTLVNMTQKPDGRLRLIAFAGTIADVKMLEKYPKPYFLVHTPDVCQTLDRYSEAGGTHHLCAMRGMYFEQLKKLASYLDMEYYQI